MKLRTYDDLVIEGYEPEVLVKSECCLHEFVKVSRLYPITNIRETLLICDHCGIDDHGAIMSGWTPKYYDHKERYV